MPSSMLPMGAQRSRISCCELKRFKGLDRMIVRSRSPREPPSDLPKSHMEAYLRQALGDSDVEITFDYAKR
jgi:hypothetical protein